MKTQFDVAIIAHRGYSKKYPENTLSAFQKAIEAKADYIELDVRLTKDGVLVVHHDKSTLRMTGKNHFVDQTDFATLRTLNCGFGKKIPTMEEVITLCKGKIGMQIELSSVGNAEPMVKLVSEFGIEKDVVFSSFIHSEIAKVKELNPSLVCAILEPPFVNFKTVVKKLFRSYKFFEDAKKIGVEGIHPFFIFANKSFCEIAHNYGWFVNPFTVDWPFFWRKLINAGVDGIITNDPESLYSLLANRKKNTPSTP